MDLELELEADLLKKHWFCKLVGGSGGEGFEGSQGPIEIHFIDEVIPGYFWIFPVQEGVVNVGIGMVISEQRKQKGADNL